ncbi:MAG: zinc ribbon domain-containing protein [Lachnospiraceae bacterium]|nr:zinc ribbon domain-containing protein [Lachnospiraceae bacterium]
MKCPTCGADMQIENEKCPFCGNPNPFAIKHQQDMKYYHSEFQKTKKEVEQKTGRFTSAAVKIPVIIILAILILVVVNTRSDIESEIRIHNIKKDVKLHEQEYREELDAYELAGDWVGLYTLFNEKRLGYVDTFEEYYTVKQAAFEYELILDDIMRYDEDSTYYNAKNLSQRIAENLERFYKDVYRIGYENDYYDNQYAPVHKEALERINEDMEAVLLVYAHLTKEELDKLPDYSVSMKSSLIEEGLLRNAD